MEEEYKRFLYDLEQEKEELKEKFQKEKDEEIEKVKREIERTCSAHSPNEREKSPVRMFNEDFDPALLLRKRTPEGKMQQVGGMFIVWCSRLSVEGSCLVCQPRIFAMHFINWQYDLQYSKTCLKRTEGANIFRFRLVSA